MGEALFVGWGVWLRVVFRGAGWGVWLFFALLLGWGAPYSAGVGALVGCALRGPVRGVGLGFLVAFFALFAVFVGEALFAGLSLGEKSASPPGWVPWFLVAWLFVEGGRGVGRAR